jgi:hypothetical protein
MDTEFIYPQEGTTLPYIEPVIRTGLVYALNYFSTTFWGAPVTKTHQDIREGA